MVVRNGLLEQTLRHTYLAWPLGAHCLILGVNEVDLYDQDQLTLSRLQANTLAFSCGSGGLESLTPSGYRLAF